MEPCRLDCCVTKTWRMWTLHDWALVEWGCVASLSGNVASDSWTCFAWDQVAASLSVFVKAIPNVNPFDRHDMVTWHFVGSTVESVARSICIKQSIGWEWMVGACDCSVCQQPGKNKNCIYTSNIFQLCRYLQMANLAKNSNQANDKNLANLP